MTIYFSLKSRVKGFLYLYIAYVLEPERENGATEDTAAGTNNSTLEVCFYIIQCTHFLIALWRLFHITWKIPKFRFQVIIPDLMFINEDFLVF